MDLVALLPFASGIVAAGAGFALNQAWTSAKERLAGFDRLISLLEMTRHELEFYQGKLQQLIEHLEGNELPSFDLFPSFLEKAKLDLSAFPDAQDIFKQITHRHFELCHIQTKIDLLRVKESNNPIRMKAADRMISQFRRGDDRLRLQKLAESNVPLFVKAAKTTCGCLDRTKSRRACFLEENLFGRLLK